MEHRLQYLADALLDTHLLSNVAKGADNACLFPCRVKHRSNACLYEPLCSIASPGKQSLATNSLTSHTLNSSTATLFYSRCQVLISRSTGLLMYAVMTSRAKAEGLSGGKPERARPKSAN